nr:MAG TPA_asm: hypothetical protein [Caudoviricetes sp.]
MNSLTAICRLPQLRMIPVPGQPLFRYERRISNRWVACNHSRARAIVGVYYRRAKALCVNSTDGLKTTTAFLSRSSDGSQKPGALSICEKVMSTANVSARSNSSSESSGK